MAMLGSYAAPQPHFAMNAHFLSTESIEVTGDEAVGLWTMLQTSTYRDGRSDLRSAALTIHCRVEDGRWRISHFITENIFSRDVDHWSDAAPISVPDSQFLVKKNEVDTRCFLANLRHSGYVLFNGVIETKGESWRFPLCVAV